MTDTIGKLPEDPEIDLGEVQARIRPATGMLGFALGVIGVSVSLAHIYFNTLGTLSTLWLTAWHFVGFGMMCTLLYPMLHPAGATARRWVLAIDILIGIATITATIFLMLQWDAINDRGVKLTPAEWAASIIVIVAAIELTRRTTGWIIPILIVLALTYVVWWGALIPGVFRFGGGLHTETVLFRSVFADEGMFGNISRISATVVFMFILFAAFLVRSGASAVIIDLARLAVGRLKGGPGLVAVFASGLTGTISGSAVANTASTGSITIPLMKRAGFPPRFAAGVEASASTGGQLMPPIMGAGAFVMSNLTAVPYTTIIAVSALPAVLYFLSVGFFVRIEAKRQDLQGADDAPPFVEVLRSGGIAFLLPIALLIYLLIDGFTPTYAAGFATIAVIGASWMTPNRMGPRAIVEALQLGARNMISTAVLLVAIGLVVNVVTTTGVGNTLALLIKTWSGNSLLIALVLIALASLILGMGLPVTAAYIILATVSASALYDLMTSTQMIDAIAAGVLPDAAKTMLLLAPPDIAGAFGKPMPLADAQALAARLTVEAPDLYLALRDQMLDPAVLTAALLSAHLIIFWLSQDSNVTPPVCLAAFTAAAIAGTPPMATGLTAWKIAKGLYVIPLLFAYTAFIGGPPEEVLAIFLFAIPGLYAISAALQGYLEAPLNWALRIVALAAGAACLWPADWYVHVAGALLFAALFAWSVRCDRRSRAGA